LGTVSEVVDLLSTVTRLWSFLENLFIHSEEVKKELPTESETFVGIDQEVQAILKEGKAIPNILKYCCKEGLM